MSTLGDGVIANYDSVVHELSASATFSHALSPAVSPYASTEDVLAREIAALRGCLQSLETENASLSMKVRGNVGQHRMEGGDTLQRQRLLPDEDSLGAGELMNTRSRTGSCVDCLPSGIGSGSVTGESDHQGAASDGGRCTRGSDNSSSCSSDAEKLYPVNKESVI